MSKRIYVGNLPWSVDKAKIEELFSGFGEIEEALVIADNYTGRSRGFGFVTFKNDADCDKAIAEMNDKEVEGRSLKVREATPRGEAESSEKGTDEKPKEEEAEKKPEKESVEEKPKEEETDEEEAEEKPVEEAEKKPEKESVEEKPKEEA